MISEEHGDLLMRVSKQVGKKFARQYPGMEPSDIASEVATQVLAEWKHISQKMARAHHYGRSQEEVLHFLLSQRASVYCGKLHYNYVINHPQVTIYKPIEVRALLKECLYNPEVYVLPSRDTDYGASVEAGSVWVNLMDLQAALSRVSDKCHDTILAAFGPEDLGLSEPDKRRVSDAVAEVARALNMHLNRKPSSHEGPGRRKALRNSRAQMTTSSLYETKLNVLENLA